MDCDLWTTILPAWIQSVGALAQVVIAGIAIKLAVAANRVSGDEIFVDRIVQEVFTIIELAGVVKQRYCTVFKVCPDVATKRQSRTDWLGERELVGTRLFQLQQLFPKEFDSALALWSTVVEVEHPHAIGDALSLPAEDARTAFVAYERAHNLFVAELSGIFKKVRTRRMAGTS